MHEDRLIRRLLAMCKMLQDDGHMTPMATRQIMRVVQAEVDRTDD